MVPARSNPLHPGRPLGAVLLLTLLTVLLHAIVLRGFFLGDDFDILLITVRHRGWSDAFHATFVGNWGPMSYVQFYLDYRIGGLDPLVYHLTNLFWLDLTVVALYGFVRSAWPERPSAAWTAALLFLTHPVNDQAVSYICARSHEMGAALAVLALSLYARFRLRERASVRRVALLAGALVAGFLAGLSKETALTLPAWVAAFEWLFGRAEGDPPLRGLRRAAGAALLFGAAAAAVFGARELVVGGAPPRLAEHAEPEVVGSLTQRVVSDLPVYVLAGGLPFPFGWMDQELLERFHLLAWILVAAALAAAVVGFAVNAVRPGAATRPAALWVLGLAVSTVTLAPLFVGDLIVQRRYFYIFNVGVVLMAVSALQELRARYPRGTRALVALLVLAGAAGTIQRNDLYRRSGNVAKNLIETVHGAPVERLSFERQRSRGVALVTLPRYYGGDRVSGAILLHLTDLSAAMHLYGTMLPDINFALKCHHAEDYSATAEFEDERLLRLVVRFRTRRAYEEALGRDIESDRWNDGVVATLLSADAGSRELTYRLELEPGFWTHHTALYLYSDDRFTALRRPAPRP